jgi:(hydroxyamino)benzene mutase
MNGSRRRLIWHGMFLFLIGLLTGFAETHFANVRMGLAAHLEGVMNGTFLMALGAVWNEVRLAARAKTIAYGTALYGTYVNWLVTVLAAVFGTGALPWQERLVTAGFLTGGLSIIAATLLALWDLRTKAEAMSAS